MYSQEEKIQVLLLKKEFSELSENNSNTSRSKKLNIDRGFCKQVEFKNIRIQENREKSE